MKLQIEATKKGGGQEGADQNFSPTATQRMNLSDLVDEHDKEEAVAEMNGAVVRWCTTALATICGVRDRRHKERRCVDEAIKTVHLLSTCIHEEGPVFC